MTFTASALPTEQTSAPAFRGRWVRWSPLAIPLLGIAGSMWAVFLGRRDLMLKENHETLAIALASTAAAAALIHLAVSRRSINLVLGCAACIVLLREIHFDWTTKFVYGAIAAIGVWTLLWRRRLGDDLRQSPRMLPWIIATGWAYALSQAVARRALQRLLADGGDLERFIDAIYDDMEEVIENISHAMLIVLVLMGRWRRNP